jgi:hypothetical protein
MPSLRPLRWIIPAGRPGAGGILSQATARRYKNKGISKAQYESGKKSLKAARGHVKTPEHGLRDAVKDPVKYREYLAKKTPDRGGAVPLSPQDEARIVNSMLDAAYQNMYNSVGSYIKYHDQTVRANVFGGQTRESGEVPGMDYQTALWTSTADTQEIRANAREQYRANPWYYH